MPKDEIKKLLNGKVITKKSKPNKDNKGLINLLISNNRTAV